MLPALFNVVNNTEQVVEPEFSLQLGVTMLNNIVDNIEQYEQHNIVQSCFQQLVIYASHTQQKMNNMFWPDENSIEQCRLVQA